MAKNSFEWTILGILLVILPGDIQKWDTPSILRTISIINKKTTAPGIFSTGLEISSEEERKNKKKSPGSYTDFIFSDLLTNPTTLVS